MPSSSLENSPNLSSRSTLDIHKIQPLSEAEKNAEFFIPSIRFGSEGAIFDEKVIHECDRVAAEVLKYLQISPEKYNNFVSPFNLLDTKALNENNLHTFPRTQFGQEHREIPVIIYAQSPVYDQNGDRLIAVYDPSNSVIFISLQDLKLQFTETLSKGITKPGDIILKKNIVDHPEVAAGIAVIEEMIHFVQDYYWGEEFGSGTTSTQSIAEHDADPVEAEARIIKNLLIELIYPQYIHRKVERDIGVELLKRVEDACMNARLIGAEDLQLRNEMLDQKQKMENQETLSFHFENTPCNVSVDSPEEYFQLLKLALRQLLIVNFGLTNEELDTDESQAYYQAWYELNTKKHFEHELGHYNGAKKFSNLKCKLGVEFTKTKMGKVNFFPFIDFEGEVPANIYREKIVFGPDELSPEDEIVLGKR